MLTTSPAVFKCEDKHAPSVVVECPPGRSGTLRTTREGKPPAESGTTVSTLDARSDIETGSRSKDEVFRDHENLRFSDDPVLNKRGASSPERGRAG